MLKKGDILIPVDNHYQYCMRVDLVKPEGVDWMKGYIYINATRLNIDKNRQPEFKRMSPGFIYHLQKTSSNNYITDSNKINK
jgi:hypothetical protein